MTKLELSPPVFSILSNLIEEKVGIHYELLDKDLLREKASARAMEAGFSSLLDYYYFLRYDAGSEQELSELVETLVVNETYFFREWPAIQMLVDSLIVPWCSAGRRPRIWSAACASGEEPLSLAMLLSERGLLGQVDIVASDISARVLAKARLGHFSKRSLRGIPEPHLPARYLRMNENGYSVSPELISAITWRQHNLLHREEFAQHARFDAVICRNVLIYFSDRTVSSVLRRLEESLVPGGVLLVGVSESLMRYGSGFQGEERGGSFIYRKPPSA